MAYPWGVFAVDQVNATPTINRHAAEHAAIGGALNDLLVKLGPLAGAGVIGASAAGVVPISAVGFAGQTAALQEWRSSGGGVLASVNAAGRFSANGFASGLLSDAVGNTVQGVAGQTANLTEWKNSAATVVAAVTPTGRMLATDGTVSLPGFAFASQPATGFYRSGSGTVGYSSGGALAVTFGGPVAIAINNAWDISVGTATGTKIGTAANQKLALWNKVPIVQPTNAIAGAAFVAGAGAAVNDASTFGGYTLPQIAAALIAFGLLA